MNMPVVKNYKYKDMPKWAKLRKYERVFMKKDEVMQLCEFAYPKVALMCLSGSFTIVDGDATVDIKLGEAYELTSESAQITAHPYYFVEKASFMLMCGIWESASFNMFRADIFENPVNLGTPCDYYRNNSFDNHYHDFDEYWILYEGHGVAYSENKPFECGPGDCVVTGMGWHHDFPIAHDYVQAVTVETEGEGQNRPDHLWEQVHGPAVPQKDRI